MYVHKGMGPSEIASHLGLKVQSVSNVIYKHGLAEKRSRMEARALARAEEQAEAEHQSFLEGVRPQARIATETALDNANAAAERGDAKEFMFWMKGGEIGYRMSVDASGVSRQESGGQGPISIVFARFPDKGAQEERAVPIEVAATDAGETLDFDESQQASAPAAESAALIGNAAQIVGNAPADTRSLNKA